MPTLENMAHVPAEILAAFAIGGMLVLGCLYTFARSIAFSNELEQWRGECRALEETYRARLAEARQRSAWPPKAKTDGSDVVMSDDLPPARAA